MASFEDGHRPVAPSQEEFPLANRWMWPLINSVRISIKYEHSLGFLGLTMLVALSSGRKADERRRMVRVGVTQWHEAADHHHNQKFKFVGLLLSRS